MPAKQLHEHHGHAGHQASSHDHSGVDTTAAQTEIDPVCGMRVSANDQRFVEHKGRKYFFCSDHCKAKFAANPDQYLKPMPAPPERPAADAIYTCPMHPEIRQSGPGHC